MTTTVCGLDSSEHHTTKMKVIGESIILPGDDEARITKLAPSGQMISYLYEDAKTQVEMMERGLRISGNGRCLGWRETDAEYCWLSYSEFLTRAKNFGSGLINLGVNLGQSTFIGIYSQNRVEWLVAQHGSFNYSSPIVPLYDTLGPDACTYMIKQGEIKVIVCDKEKKVQVLLDRVENTPSLKYIICINEVCENLHKLAKEKKVELHLFQDVENIGKLKPVPRKLPKPDDVALICYTSGTTGNPKGAVLTHKNTIAGPSGMLHQMGSFAPNKNTVMISYLPLAHVMEQTAEITVFMNGGCIGFFRGDVNLLLEDMEVLQPTYFPAVPRLLNKLYDKAQAQVRQDNLKSEVYTAFEKHKKEILVPELDSKLYEKFMKSLGGKVRLIFSAAAPISETVLKFYHQALGCDVVEVYGQTEVAGPVTTNVVSETSTGNVGPPVACCIVKLVDDPSLGYFRKNNTGEICIKGHNLCRGYYKDPERTAEAIDEQGWLHTGDIGMWCPNGTLKVIDRKKHIFKLSQGEYVVPEKLEIIYIQSPYISQILITGDSLRSFLVAIVIPDQEVVMSWSKENSKYSTWLEICRDPSLKQLIMDDMKRIAQKAGLLSFEQVKKIHLYPKLLTHEDGFLTPTLKTRREICRKYFEKEIQQMYERSDF